jgi:hypothetical protein
MIFLLIIHFNSFSQDRNGPPFTTPNTHDNPDPDPKSDKPKEKQIRYIIKKDTKKFLAGNKCYEDVTKKMGFMYLAMPKGQSNYETEFDRNLHNLSVKMHLLFTRGPFWKMKVNKYYKKCQYPYGDSIG